MLDRLFNFGLKLEAVEGVSEAVNMLPVHYQGTLTKASHKPVGHEYERDEKKSTLSPTPTEQGGFLQEIVVEVELAGGDPDVANAAKWHDRLQTCGMAAPTQLRAMIVSGIAGTFTYGETIGNNPVEGTATHKGRFVSLERFVNDVGDPPVYYVVYEATLGTFADTDTLKGYTSLATAAVDGVPVLGGCAQRMLSETDLAICKSGTSEARTGGQVHRAIGSRGNVKFMIEHSKSLRAEFTMRGVKDVDFYGDVPDGSLIANIPKSPRPTMVGKRAFPVLFNAYSPVFTQCTIDFGNTLADRPSVGTGVGLLSGEEAAFEPTRIGGRKITVTIDPEHVVKATWNFYGDWMNGALFPLYIPIGNAFSTNGKVLFAGPAAQIVGSEYTASERQGIIIHNPTVKMTGEDDDELVIYHILIAGLGIP